MPNKLIPRIFCKRKNTTNYTNQKQEHNITEKVIRKNLLILFIRSDKNTLVFAFPNFHLQRGKLWFGRLQLLLVLTISFVLTQYFIQTTRAGPIPLKLLIFWVECYFAIASEFDSVRPRSSRSQIFLKISVLKNFATKHLRWSLFLIKLQT